jgi:preprotein translocase subunit YajC
MLDIITIAQSGGGGGGAGSFIINLIPLVLIFLIFWFFLIRPQQKKQQEHEEFLKSLKVGDRVVTAGGIIGEIKAVDGDTVQLQINRDNRVDVLREQIQGPESDYVGSDDEDEDDEEMADKEE